MMRQSVVKEGSGVYGRLELLFPSLKPGLRSSLSFPRIVRSVLSDLVRESEEQVGVSC